jgi:ubiquinone/menaquinone biosynthesis C-methylase UbiE
LKKSHLFNPEHIGILESEDRKIWQSPDAILDTLEIKPHFTVADLGCGSGYFTLPLAAKARRVYGIDVQKEMIDYVRTKIRKLKIKNVELLVSKPSEIPLEDGSVDLLLTVNTLHEFDNKERMIKEMRRVVKKGSKILIADFMKKETEFGPPVEIRVSKAKAVKLFEAESFALVEKRDLPYHYLLVFVRN